MNPTVRPGWQQAWRLRPLLLGLCCLPAASATWEPLLRTGQGVWTVRVESPSDAAPLRTVQTLYSPLPVGQATGGPAAAPVISQMIGYEVQCAQRQLRRTTVTLLQAGRPDRPGGWPAEAALSSPKPDTVGEEIVSRLCDAETALAQAATPEAWEPVMNSTSTRFVLHRSLKPGQGSRRTVYLLSLPREGAMPIGNPGAPLLARLLAMGLQCDSRMSRVLWVREWPGTEPQGVTRRLDSPATALAPVAPNTLPERLITRVCEAP